MSLIVARGAKAISQSPGIRTPSPTVKKSVLSFTVDKEPLRSGNSFRQKPNLSLFFSGVKSSRLQGLSNFSPRYLSNAQNHSY